MCWNWICMCVHAKIVWFCSVQKMNCVVGSESGVRCWICVVRSESSFHCWICVVRSESGVRCQIMLFAINQVFAAEFVLSIANQVFPAELCCPQRIKFFCRSCVVCSKSAFVVEVVLSASEVWFNVEIELPAVN
jgi:hypothetical protein